MLKLTLTSSRLKTDGFTLRSIIKYDSKLNPSI